MRSCGRLGVRFMGCGFLYSDAGCWIEGTIFGTMTTFRTVWAFVLSQRKAVTEWSDVLFPIVLSAEAVGRRIHVPRLPDSFDN